MEDGLGLNQTHIQLFTGNDLRFVLGAKFGDHKPLFSQIDVDQRAEKVEFQDEDGTIHRFHYVYGAPINKSHSGLMINFTRCTEINPNGSINKFSWVTEQVFDPLRSTISRRDQEPQCHLRNLANHRKGKSRNPQRSGCLMIDVRVGPIGTHRASRSTGPASTESIDRQRDPIAQSRRHPASRPSRTCSPHRRCTGKLP